MNQADKPEGTDALAVVATRGVFWVGGGQVVLQIIQIATTVVLARLLIPEYFGLIGMAMVFVGIAQLIADFGLGSAIVQAKAVSPDALSSAFWLNGAVGLALMLAAIAAAPFVAAFYDNPEIEDLVMALAVTLFASALNAVPSAILYKAMNFAALAKARVLATVIGSAIAVAMAASGYGVWSLVAQPITGAVVNLAVTWRLARWLPRLAYSFQAVRPLIAFSAAVLTNSILHYASRNTDHLLIGRYLGSQPLGYYAMAYQLMLYPMNQVASVIIRVLFPTLSQLQDDMDQFRRAYLKSVSVITLVTFPMMLGLFAVAPDFIAVVFGEKWQPMETVLRILSIAGLIQSAITGLSTILLAIGRTTTIVVLGTIGSALTIGAFFVGLPWGIEGVAAAYTMVFLLFSEFYLAYVFRIVGIRLADYHRALARPAIAAAIMFAAVSLLDYTLRGGDIDPTARLAVSVAAGISVYAAASFAINRAEIVSIYALARAALARR
jgi:PST family polysaccharide transporter